ncbi:MAG: M15 family metallopeptidase, partial [Clostridiales Family XIII bacterium]|nr:M15 family metallopeptidase [Clostridiales Family XIII bacterium]
MNARLVRRRQRRRRFAISVIVFLAIVGFGGAYALHENQLPNIAPSTTISLTDSLVESKTVEPPAQANYLILVNAENPLSNVDEKFDIVSAYGVLPLAESDIMLEKNTLDALVLMFQAAEEEGIDDLIVSSGYRNERLQQQLYAEAIDKSYVQKPGYSEHQTGLAVDIAFNDVWAGGLMDDSWKAQWLAENAW